MTRQRVTTETLSREKFRYFTTSGAFHFHITGPQAEFLDLLVNHYEKRLEPSHFITLDRGLERRGLIYYEEYWEKGRRKDSPPFVRPKVTEAGFLIHRMLQISGVIPETKKEEKAA